MKANELRVGNLIRHGWIDMHGILHSTIHVTGIMKQIVILDDNRLPDYLNLYEKRIEPIPLTEEWLVKFGFEKVVNKAHGFTYSYYQLNDVLQVFLIANQEYEVQLKTGTEWVNFYRQYKHVHQLQNLYFALTGKELQVKE